MTAAVAFDNRLTHQEDLPDESPPRRNAGTVQPAGHIAPAGQLVVVIARWVLVLAGFTLSIWNPAPLPELRVQIGTLLVLAVANFYLHAQLLRRRPVIDAIAYGAAAADLVVITAMVAVQGGFASHLFVFYCVALLAMSVAFPLGATIIYAGVTTTVYALASLASLPARTDDMDLLDLLCRVLMLGAVAACGQVFRHVERVQAATRRSVFATASASATVSALRLEHAQDVFFGQVVLLWARWAVIAAGAIMALWMSDAPQALVVNILPVVVLMAVNFYLHARYLLERPANATLTQALSTLDIAMITAIIAVWDGHRGLESPFFVYYFPVLLGVAFVFPPRFTAVFTGTALAAYTAVCLATDLSFVSDPSSLKLLAVRLITLGAMGGLGTFYWRLQRRTTAPASSSELPLTYSSSAGI